MPAIAETARPRILTKIGLLERVVNTSGLDNSVERTEAQCSLERFSSDGSG